MKRHTMKSPLFPGRPRPRGAALLWAVSLWIAIASTLQAREFALPGNTHLRLSALAGGLRYIPDPGERSYLDDLNSSPDTTDELDANDWATEPTDEVPAPPTKYNSRWQSYGIIIRAGEPARSASARAAEPAPDSEDIETRSLVPTGFHYRAELGLFFQEGGDELNAPGDETIDRRDYTRETAPPPSGSGLRMFPGNDLWIGFRSHHGLNVALGRLGAPEEWQDNLLGGHGPLTGVHLGLTNEYATVRVTPYHRHPLAGNYIPGAGDPALLHRMGRRQSNDLRDLSRGSESHGQRFDFLGHLGMLRLGFSYGANHQNETARLSGDQQAIDRVEYSGIGIGLGRESVDLAWQIYVHGERSLGFTRSLGRRPDGESSRRIDGRAYRAGAEIRGRRFSAALRLFLPEPETPARSGDGGQSGYVGYGDLAPRTPLLGGALHARPAPVLCPDRDRCEGILNRRDLPGFASHAGVAELSLGWRGQFVLIDLNAALLRPLPPRPDRTAELERVLERDVDSLWKSEPDENASGYFELALSAGWHFPDGRLRLQYARLMQQRLTSGAARLAGEALFVTMEYGL